MNWEGSKYSEGGITNHYVHAISNWTMLAALQPIRDGLQGSWRAFRVHMGALNQSQHCLILLVQNCGDNGGGINITFSWWERYFEIIIIITSPTFLPSCMKQEQGVVPPKMTQSFNSDQLCA